jgi:predicted nucleotidyltransferase
MNAMKLTREEILHTLSTMKPQLQKAGIVEIGLFGSYAKGKEGVYSDVDIAIRKEKEMYYKKGAYGYFEMLEEVRDVLRKKLHRKIDLFDLDSNSPLKKEIEKEVIYV